MITSDTEISVTVDWYSYTADSPLYHARSTMKCVELDRGMLGYTNGVKFLDGRVELVNPDRPQMRVHVQYSGTALATGNEIYKVSPYEIISIITPGERVSRIDIAIDVRKGSLYIAGLAEKVNKGKYISPAKKSMYISTLGEKGETLYVGAPSSKVRCRIYDKAAELGINENWTRIELQVRGKRAGNVKSALVKGGSDMSSIPKIIKGFLDFPDMPEYALVVGCKSLGLSAPNRSDSDTREWLMTTVISSLAREIARDETGKFKSDFLTSLNGQIAEEKKKIKQA